MDKSRRKQFETDDVLRGMYDGPCHVAVALIMNSFDTFFFPVRMLFLAPLAYNGGFMASLRVTSAAFDSYEIMTSIYLLGNRDRKIMLIV